MEVILSQDIERLGKSGTVVKVKDGFARNFLIPNGLALPVTSGNLKKLEQEKLKQASQLEKLKKEAEGLAEQLSGVSLTIPSLIHEEDKLYGSITSTDIAAALKEEGFDIDKDHIQLGEPIKSLGIYEVEIKLHPEVSTKVKIWVVKK
ncbi:MAG: 50S ribosomal protein L9 [Candidatus Omnitrophica bacterium]|nr:50S ribosomal protein L9 [Candidatus Omnitrophota bacterium]MBI5145030.1 50S ribosomal protein L9 [Candidatus Omnitrophota bacterium]